MNENLQSEGEVNAIPRGHMRRNDGSVVVEPFDFGAVVDDVHDSNCVDIDLGDHVLGLAETSEVELIRPALQSLKGGLGRWQPPPAQMMIADPSNSNSWSESTDKSEWRFCVVRPKPECATPYYKIEQALRISDADLMVGPWWRRGANGEVHALASLQPLITRMNDVHLARDHGPFEPHRVQSVVNARASFCEEDFPAIHASLDRFLELDIVPVGDLKLLGYFSILESLLSHAPDPSESADSISRQLKRNLILLHNRADKGSGLGFDEVDCRPAKLVSKLYKLRSAVAHGVDPSRATDLLTQVLPKLSTRRNIDAFVRRMVRRTLVTALVEPRLVTDLKG